MQNTLRQAPESPTHASRAPTAHQQQWQNQQQKGGRQGPLNTASSGSGGTYAPTQPYNIYTDSEKLKINIKFDYVATAASFIIENIRGNTALLDAYRSHAANWIDRHSRAGQDVTIEECNMYTDQLMMFLRRSLPTAVVVAADKSFTRGS